jgi:hypothetical protein
VVLAARPAIGQSLAEVAKKEEARRATVAAPAKTYTNTDLKPDPTRSGAAPAPAPAPGTAAPPAAAAAGGTTPAGGAPSGNATAEGTPEPKPGEVVQRNDTFNEQYWRGQAESIRRRLEAARKTLDQLQSANPDPRNAKEQARIDTALKRAQAAVKALEEEQLLFLTRADANKVPKAWIQ